MIDGRSPEKEETQHVAAMGRAGGTATRTRESQTRSPRTTGGSELYFYTNSTGLSLCGK
jgi:hypothetical protein